MTNKENVLQSYPKAHLVRFPEKIDPEEQDRWNNEYFLVTWEEQTVEQFIKAYAETEDIAWKRAWETIQREMLTQLENS